MKPPPFAYARARSLEEALLLLEEGGDDAKPLAGGQSLVPALNFRLVRPTHLVDVNGVPGLDGVRESDGGLAVGALVRHATLARLDPGDRGALPAAARAIGHDAIRVRGTLGGSLAHADPAAELPVVALALDAQLLVEGARAGRRTVAAADFFLGPFTTSLAPGELLVEVRFPALPAGARTAFAELARRPGDFALACVCVAAGPGWARIAAGGVGATPVRAPQAEALLAAGGAAAVDDAAATAARELEVYGDRTADESYRRGLVRTLTRRALAEALGGP